MLIREAVWFKLLLMFPLKNISGLLQLGEAVAASEDTEQDVLQCCVRSCHQLQMFYTF